MERAKTIFSQLFEFIPKRQFRRCVERYSGNYRVKNFSCWNQFVCMCFAQLTERDSLRSVEVCLRSMHEKLLLLGFNEKVSRSTLADANEKRDYRIYRDFCQILIKQARELYSEEFFLKELETVVYVLDSTIISLCLSLFPWASFGQHSRAQVKVHALLDLRGPIPSFIAITSAKYPDCAMLDNIVIEPGAFYAMDKAYVDFQRLDNINKARGYFVVLAKRNLKIRRISSNAADKSSGVSSDQVIRLCGRVASAKYQQQLRRIRFYDQDSERYFVFLTNNFNIDAFTITEIYKARWQIEIFFKWIKQNLKIKKFLGNSVNAVQTQVWIAISTYLIIAIVKKRLNLQQPLYKILQVLSVALFEQKPISTAFFDVPIPEKTDFEDKQLDLFKC